MKVGMKAGELTVISCEVNVGKSCVTERDAFEVFARNCPIGVFDITRKGEGYWSSHTQLMWDTWLYRSTLDGKL